MAFIRWDPFRDLLSLQEQMNRLFEESLARSRGGEETVPGFWTSAVDIFETADHMVFRVELPGLARADVNLEIKNDVLTLQGERKFQGEVKRENYHRIERAYGRFKRSFNLPANIDKEKVGARLSNGVLEITIAKKEEAKPRKIAVMSG